MTSFETLQHIIRERRTTKPAVMNGKKIDNHLIQQLLELADWAPTHAHTEPWRFVVYSGDAVQSFCTDHAQLYKTNTPPDKFTTANYDKLLHMGDNLSHIIAVYTKRGDNPKIPLLEEISAVAAAIQNMLLGASALGIAALWSTGGFTHHPAMKQYFSLATEDVMMGLLYLGYADEASKQGTRIVPLTQKVLWK